MKKLLLLVAVLIAGGNLNAGTENSRLIPVLCLASEDTSTQGLNSIAPKALEAYRKLGYDMHFNFYQKVGLPELLRYPIVVGMMPMLHAGTRAVDERLGKDFDTYLRAGGGIIMIPAPSYYGTEDFVRQLNPWLSTYGARLLSEIPLDPTNQKEIVRILGYRYLRTANLDQSHPVTQGIDHIWLPLDFSNQYVTTYSMTLSEPWQTLVRGEKSCATYPFSSISKGVDTVGTWKSEPPFLAVRDVGKGRLAIFTTASGYYIYDAYHWSQADGFVLTEGNGLQLMDRLFRYVSAARRKLPPVSEGGTAEAEKIVQGNLPVMPDKVAWIDYAMKHFTPKGFGVRYYIDCGAVADLPYNRERGYGYIDEPGTNWLIRWAWSEIFHATAANCRACDIKDFSYRFDSLDPDKKYALGIMVWAYQPEGTRELVVSFDGKTQARLTPPRFDQRQSPLFQVMEIPASAIKDRSLNVGLGRGGGSGTFTGICELWLFEGGILSPQAAEFAAKFEAPAGGFKETLNQNEYFPGLIGARSPYTDGKSSVAEMAAAADKADLRFLVFTDELAKLNPEKLSRLKADCAAASNARFTAIPGIQLTAAYRDRPHRPDDPKTYGEVNACFFGNVCRLPNDEEMKNPYNLFWQFFGGEFCGGTRVPANLTTPGHNGISPFFQRFWRGFDLYTYDADGKVADDSTSAFSDLLAHGYGPYPRTSGDYRSTDDIIQAAADHGKVTILARNQEEMPLYHYSSSITTGPEIRTLAFSFDYMRDGENGGGMLFSRQTWLLAHLGVRYKTPISEVTLYRGLQPIRKWFPNRRFVRIDEPILISQQCELSWAVRAADGTEARTGRFQCQDNAFLSGMCADNQNTICSVTRPPSAYERDERELYLQHSYWHTGEAGGQLGVLRDGRELVPRVIETGIIQLCKYFHPAPCAEFSGTRTEDHIFSEMRIVGASRAFNLIRYDFNAKEADFTSRTDITAFRPLDNGATAVMLETTLMPRRDIAASELDRIRFLEMAMMPPLPPLWKYTVAGGSSAPVTGQFTDIPSGKDVIVPMAAKGGLMLWPNDLASLVILPLDGQAYQVVFDNLPHAWNGRERLRIFQPGRDLRAGEVIRSRFLVMLYPHEIKKPGDLMRISAEYAARANTISKISAGKLIGTEYVLDLEAREDSVDFTAVTPRNADPVPLRVKGMNPNWSCGLWQNGRLELFSTVDGTLYAVLPPGTDGRIVAGHPLMSSVLSSIEWNGLWQGGIRARVHNPSGTEIMVKFFTNPIMTGLPSYCGKIKMAAGESRWIWGCDGVTVFEAPGFLVEQAEKTSSGLKITMSNGKVITVETDDLLTVDKNN